MAERAAFVAVSIGVTLLPVKAVTYAVQLTAADAGTAEAPIVRHAAAVAATKRAARNPPVRSPTAGTLLRASRLRIHQRRSQQLALLGLLHCELIRQPPQRKPPRRSAGQQACA